MSVSSSAFARMRSEIFWYVTPAGFISGCQEGSDAIL